MEFTPHPNPLQQGIGISLEIHDLELSHATGTIEEKMRTLEGNLSA